MNRLIDLVEFWSSWLIHAGWQSAIVVGGLAVWLLMARRRSAQFRYALLMIALAKFAVPPFLTMPVGLFSHSSPTMAAGSMLTVPHSASVGHSVEGRSDEAAAQQALLHDFSRAAARNSLPETTLESGLPGAGSRPASQTVRVRMIPWWPAGIVLVHLAGLLIAGRLFLERYQQLRRLLRATTAPPESILSMAQQLATALGIRSLPSILVSDDCDAPFATGALAPAILLPRSMLDLPADQLRIIIGHELVHIRRFDLIVGWIEIILGSLWWFHPAMWWLKREMRRTREDCCDDLILTSQTVAPDRYCETLIEAARRQTFSLPEPMALGFSEGEHPAARRIRRLMDSTIFRPSRLTIMAVVLVSVVGLLILPGMRPFKAPVSPTSLEGLFGWRNLSFDPDQEELDIVKECHQVVNKYRSTYQRDGRAMRHFDDPETRQTLEDILKRKPDFFYPQFLLGTWYRRNGQLDKAQQLLTASLKNSPIVLTQRYKQGNGDPLTNVSIDGMAIECNRVKNHSLNPDLKLEFVDLVTDSEGEIAIPVYDTVFRLSSRSFPKEYDTEMSRLGWFQSRSRIGILPEITAWKRYSRPQDFTRSARESSLLSGAKGTTTSEITSGSNRYRIGRVARCQADGRFSEQSNGNSSSLPNLPQIANARYMDHAIIDLADPAEEKIEIQAVTVLDSRTKIPLTSFQSAAGVKVFDKRRFHLYSLYDNLPEAVDLVLTVHNFAANSFQMIIPVENQGTYQKEGVTFVIEYLGAGEHAGWSSREGFYQNADYLDFMSEMLCSINDSSGRRFTLLMITKDGQRIALQTSSPHVRIPKPLSEIDHFELIPAAPAEMIYFEKIALPPRSDTISRELPEVEFSLNGKPETVTTDLFSPLVLRCRTRQGDAYVNSTFSGEFGYGVRDRQLDQQAPDSSSTVLIEAFAPSSLLLAPTYYSRETQTRINVESRGGCSGPWGTVTVTRLAAPLSDVKSVKVQLHVKSSE